MIDNLDSLEVAELAGLGAELAREGYNEQEKTGNVHETDVSDESFECETQEMESLANRIQQEEESAEPISVLTRRKKAKDRPMDEFDTYLKAVLKGEVDVEWAVFNRQGI